MSDSKYKGYTPEQRLAAASKLARDIVGISFPAENIVNIVQTKWHVIFNDHPNLIKWLELNPFLNDIFDALDRYDALRQQFFRELYPICRCLDKN